jgi:altered-inheritance-of-mitochondria protein 5
MGFANGFTGGVTLTLGLAYLAVLTHQRNRQTQSDLLRAQQTVLNSLVHDPSVAQRPAAPYAGLLTREEPNHHFVETVKSRWNAEIENAVRWAQTKDWNATREWAESLILGSRPAEAVREEVSHGFPAVRREAAELSESGKSAFQEARVKSGEFAQAAKERAAVLADGGKELAQAAKERAAVLSDEGKELAQAAKERAAELADEGKEALSRGVERSREIVHAGVEKGKELAHKAATEVGNAERKLEHKVDEGVLRYSAVDRALAQRYKSDGGQVMNKTVEEVLRERYQPIAQKSPGQAQDTDVVGYSARDDV